MDYRRMYDDKEMLYAYDLEEFNGQDAVFQIKSVSAGELVGQKGRKSKKPFITFHDPDGKLHGKKLAANKTNGKSIAKMYGKDASKWAGQWIAMYCTTVDYDGEVTDCIRVRPQRPDVQRPAQNGKSAPRKAVDVESLIAAFGGCDELDMFEALESDRKAAWSSISKEDKLRVKAAAEQAHSRLHSTDAKQSEPDADEAAEIAKIEAAQS